MNYTELEQDDDKNYLLNLFNFDEREKENYIDGRNILITYNRLNHILEKYKKDKDKLITQKDFFYSYKYNLLNNHLEIINISNEYSISNSTEVFTNYDNLIKELYNKWLENYYKSKIIEIDRNIDNIETKISNFRKLFIYIFNDLNANSDNVAKKICPICFENEVDMSAIPCGHTCCNKCIISSRTNIYNNERCLVCRNNIDKYIKIYFMI